MADASLRAARRRVGRSKDKALFLLLPLAFSILSTAACTTTATRTLPPAAAGHPAAARFDESPVRLPRYRSRRLGLSLPLPDGRAWIIDDHSRPELVAKHPATRSTVLVALIRTTENVGRAQCEELAKAQGLIAARELNVVEDEIAITQKTFDTHIRTGLEPVAAPDQPLVGHVTAFGGFRHKCLVFDFSTEVDGAAQEPALSARLAVARTRILDGLELDAFAAVPAAHAESTFTDAPR